MVIIVPGSNNSSNSSHRSAGITIPARCDRYPEGVGVLPEDLLEFFRSYWLGAARTYVAPFTQNSRNRETVGEAGAIKLVGDPLCCRREVVFFLIVPAISASAVPNGSLLPW